MLIGSVRFCTVLVFYEHSRNPPRLGLVLGPCLHHLGKRMNMTKTIRNQALNDWLRGDESNWKQTRPYTTDNCEPFQGSWWEGIREENSRSKTKNFPALMCYLTRLPNKVDRHTLLFISVNQLIKLALYERRHKLILKPQNRLSSVSAR